MYDEELGIIKKILMEVMEIDSDELDKYDITRETNLINKTGENQINMSSIDYVKFIAEVESEFKILYDFDGELNTIGDVLDYIHKYKKWRKTDE